MGVVEVGGVDVEPDVDGDDDSAVELPLAVGIIEIEMEVSLLSQIANISFPGNGVVGTGVESTSLHR